MDGGRRRRCADPSLELPVRAVPAGRFRRRPDARRCRSGSNRCRAGNPRGWRPARARIDAPNGRWSSRPAHRAGADQRQRNWLATSAPRPANKVGVVGLGRCVGVGRCTPSPMLSPSPTSGGGSSSTRPRRRERRASGWVLAGHGGTSSGMSLPDYAIARYRTFSSRRHMPRGAVRPRSGGVGKRRFPAFSRMARSACAGSGDCGTCRRYPVGDRQARCHDDPAPPVWPIAGDRTGHPDRVRAMVLGDVPGISSATGTNNARKRQGAGLSPQPASAATCRTICNRSIAVRPSGLGERCNRHPLPETGSWWTVPRLENGAGLPGPASCGNGSVRTRPQEMRSGSELGLIGVRSCAMRCPILENGSASPVQHATPNTTRSCGV